MKHFKFRSKTAKLIKILITMVRKKKIIQIPRKNVGLLAKATLTSETTVYNALAFRSDSENAKQIRRLAMSAYGGIETVKTIL